MKAPCVLILQGLPASGKTTFAKALQEKEPGKWKRINNDELRAMLDNGYYEKGMDALLLRVRNAMLDVYLAEGVNVILDNTHLNPWVLRKVQAYIGDRAEVEVRTFDTSIEECIARDKKRPHSVGEAVIREMAERFK